MLTTETHTMSGGYPKRGFLLASSFKPPEKVASKAHTSQMFKSKSKMHEASCGWSNHEFVAQKRELSTLGAQGMTQLGMSLGIPLKETMGDGLWGLPEIQTTIKTMGPRLICATITYLRGFVIRIGSTIPSAGLNPRSKTDHPSAKARQTLLRRIIRADSIRIPGRLRNMTVHAWCAHKKLLL